MEIIKLLMERNNAIKKKNKNVHMIIQYILMAIVIKKINAQLILNMIQLVNNLFAKTNGLMIQLNQKLFAILKMKIVTLIINI